MSDIKFVFQEELDGMRKRYAQKPYATKRLPRPQWMDQDELSILYEEQEQLFMEGSIHYGCIVQANTILFQGFPHKNCPANLIYSTDSIVDADPKIIEQIANELYSYKGMKSSKIPKEYRKIVRVIKDELSREAFVQNFKLPDGRWITIHFLSIMVFRKHLPKRRLIGSLVPVIVEPSKFKSAMILPRKYWGSAFKKKFWST